MVAFARVSGVILWWGSRAPVRVTLAGRTTILLHVTNLQLSHLLLQVGDILAAIADVGVDSLLHEGVVGRLPHVTGSGDKGLLPLDLVGDRGDQLVPVHDG